MPRTVAKKPLSLLFAFVVLTVPEPLNSVKNSPTETINPSDPCQTSPTKKTIPEIPADCLLNILHFFYPDTIRKLRCVNSYFKDFIDNSPCYLAYINKRSHFLHYQLESDQDCFYVWLDNEKSVEKFVNEPFLSDVKKKRFYIYMKLDEKQQVEFLPSILKRLKSRLRVNDNGLESLEIKYHNDYDYIKVNEYTKFGQVKDVTIRKKSISNEELNMLGGIRGLLKICEGKSLVSSEIKCHGIGQLLVWHCKELDFSHLKNFPNLRKLELNILSKVEGKKLENAGLNKLQELIVWLCKTFNLTGLSKLPSLHTLEIDEYGTLINSSPEKFKNIQKLKLSGLSSHFKKNFEKKVEDKVYKFIEIAGKLKKLRKLTVYGNYASLKKPDIIKALKNLKLNGCRIKIPAATNCWMS